MSSIYIHIPFCKQRCIYCDFHFVISKKKEKELINSIIKEIRTRKDYLKNKKLSSIYFGGGTPSIISTHLIKKILKNISEEFIITDNTEITIETNPDDINKKKLDDYFNMGINRLSIGIQSFDDKILKSLNRSHNAMQAKNSIEIAINSRIKNISVDIMFNLPNQGLTKLDESLNICFGYDINHLSIYGLTIEPYTVLHKRILQNEINKPSDAIFIKQYNHIADLSEKKGFLNYEISNFSKKNYESNHNKTYWFGSEYLGVGPSAHSFNGLSRRWNVKNNFLYMKYLKSDTKYYECETLSKKDIYNEYIMRRLRTNKGINIKDIKHKTHKIFFLKRIKSWQKDGYISNKKTFYFLERKGKIICDKITESLFLI